MTNYVIRSLLAALLTLFPWLMQDVWSQHRSPARAFIAVVSASTCLYAALDRKMPMRGTLISLL